MAYGALTQESGALSPLSQPERRKLKAALDRVAQSAGGAAYGSAPPSVGVSTNPGTEMGPTQSTGKFAKDFAKQAAIGLATGFGFGPLGAIGMGKYAMNPSQLTDTGLTNIGGLGSIAFSPGPIGPLLDMTGFGALARTAGALNRANLQRIAATDPNASMVSGPGWGGAFSNGTFSGTLPGGLEAATRRAMIHAFAQQHYRDRNRDKFHDLSPGSKGVQDAGKDEANSNAG